MFLAKRGTSYVLATGEGHSVREFIEKAFARVSRKIIWKGKKESELGIEAGTGRVLIEVDPRYYRPTEAETLVGDPSKARQKLGWKHRVSFDSLIAEMVEEDLNLLRNQTLHRNYRD